jgi:hypothetical protein
VTGEAFVNPDAGKAPGPFGGACQLCDWTTRPAGYAIAEDAGLAFDRHVEVKHPEEAR